MRLRGVLALALVTGAAVALSPAVSRTPLGASPAPAPSEAGEAASSFTFLVYGDSRAGSDCSDNADHQALVKLMAAEPADLAFHLGDMITGYNKNTNWAQKGTCPGPAGPGSFRDLIAPLTSRQPTGSLPTFLFPVIGNHDGNWGPWYPDSFGDGVCAAWPPALVRALVPNHTQQKYFKGKGDWRLKDDRFYSGMCSTDQRQATYPHYFYYSFDHKGSHFVVLQIDFDYFDFFTCNQPCDKNYGDYSQYYRHHQLDFLRDDLARARANPQTRNIFAFLHANVFTSGDQHPAFDGWSVLSQELSKHGVKAAFTSHNHVYERTVPIFVTPANPGGSRDDKLGTTYVVSGGGGSPLHTFFEAKWFDARRDSRKHYVRVKVAGTQIRVDAVGQTGEVFDTATQ